MTIGDTSIIPGGRATLTASLRRFGPTALAALRVVTSLLFLEHGLMILLSFPAAVPGMPSPTPAIMLLGGVIETVCGVLIALGLLTRFAAFVASGQMAVAYFIFHMPHGFWPALNQGDPAVLFCFVFLYLAFEGPGTFSVDSAIGDRGYARPATTPPQFQSHFELLEDSADDD